MTARRARAHDRVRVRVYYYAVYSINTVQYPTGKTKKEGTDSLTLVNVFILYTHCHKYRIYFYPEVPTTKSQGWVPTKHTTVTEGALTLSPASWIPLRYSILD